MGLFLSIAVATALSVAWTVGLSSYLRKRREREAVDERAKAFFNHVAGFDLEEYGGRWDALPASCREWFKTTIPEEWKS